MLTRFYARNYKGLSMDPLTLGRVNVFIGPNNCGKSNLFSAVSFLFDMFGRPEEGRGSLQAALKRREQGAIVTYGEETVEIRWDFNDYAYGFSLVSKGGAGLRLRDERVELTQGEFRRVYQSKVDTDQVDFWVTDSEFGFSGEGRFRNKSKSHSESVFQSIPELERAEPVPDEQDAVFLRPFVSNEIGVVGMLMRGASWQSHVVRLSNVVPPDVAASRKVGPAEALDDRALDLTNLLHAWLKTPEFHSRLVSELSPLLPGLTDLCVFEGGGYRWIQLHLRGEWRNLSELSDGTVIAVLLAAILFAPTRSQTLIIDEPELNLHPAWARVVAGWILRQTAWAQVLVGTHSPEILDPLTESFRQGDASLFVFQRAEQGFRVEPCPAERLAGKIGEGWQLGDLYRVGDPALGGWPW